MSSRALIVGGGVIGAACAHFLVQDGWNVTVVDRGEFGRGCSHGNCGFVCPSHVLPLAEPGAVGRAIKALFQPNSPFSIKPRLDWQLWSWLLRFARRCNGRDMLEAGAACQALLDSSMRLYPEIIERESLDCEWQVRGMMFAYRSQQEFDSYAATDRILRELFHHPAARLDGAAIVQREPALKPGLAGGWYYESDGHLRPDRLMSAWRQSLQRRSVEVIERREVRGFVRQGDQAVAVRTDQGDIPADRFIVAAGAWTPLLNSDLGCKIPIQPGKGYSLTMSRPEHCPNIPMIFPETRVAVTPWPSGYRLGSTMEFAGYDASLPERRLDLLRRGAEPYLIEPLGEPLHERWFGWRPMTYDGKPIIDFSPALKNVLISAGHNMLGLSMAPATGKLVAELFGGRAAHVDPRPYRVTRF